MNKLVRNITLVSSAGLGVAIFLLAALTWINTKVVVVQTIESQAESLARSIENSLGPRFHSDLLQSSEADLQELRERPESRRIDEILKDFSLNTPVPKITIYNESGAMVYSSEPELIGADWNRHPDILARALRGKPASTMNFNIILWTDSEAIENRDLVSSYIPIVIAGHTLGVFEIFTDVSPLAAGIRKATAKLVLLLLAVFCLLFFVQHRLARRAEATIREQQADLEAGENLRRDQEAARRRESSEIETIGKRLREDQALLGSIGNIQSRPVDEVDERVFLEAMLPDLIRSSASEYGFFAASEPPGEEPDDGAELRVRACLGISRDGETGGLQDDAPQPGFGLADLGELKNVSLKTDAPVIANGLTGAESGENRPEYHPTLHSFLGMPLRRQGRFLGLLGLANRPGGYDEDAARALEPVLEAVGLVLELRRAWEDKRTAQGSLELAQRSRDEAQAHKKAIVDSARDGIVTIDHDAQVVDCNPAAQALLGTKAGAAEGKSLAELLSPPDQLEANRTVLRQFLASRLGGNREGGVELPARHADGGEFLLELRAAPFEQHDSRFFTALLHDLSEREQAKVELRSQSDRHRRTEEALREAHDHMARLEDRAEEARQEISASVEAEREARQELDDQTRLLKNEVAQRIEAEQQALANLESVERSGRVKTEFLINMSQELRTPVNAIVGFSETILNRGLSDIGETRLLEYIGYVRDSARQLLEAIRESLDLARVEAGRTQFNPGDAVALGSYASLSARGRSELEIAEALFKLAIADDPGNAVVLENYSLFRTSIRDDHQRTDEQYQDAIAADPENVFLLGNYAVFLAEIYHHYDEADAIYKRAFGIDPGDAELLANYARFMIIGRDDYDRAEALYQRALEADPENPNVLADYAGFLKDMRGDYERAEAHYKAGIAAGPTAPVVLREYAALLLMSGRLDEGSKLLAEAVSGLLGQELLHGLYLQYAYARTDSARAEPLARIYDMLESKVRIPNFDSKREIGRALEAGHPEAELLDALARVIAVRDDPGALARFSVWKALEKVPPKVPAPASEASTVAPTEDSPLEQ